MGLLNKIIENNIIFGCVIAVLSIVLIILVILIIRSLKQNHKINIYEEELEDEEIKRVRKVKKEDIIEEPDYLDDDYKEEIKVEDKKQEEVKNVEYDDISDRYSMEKEMEEVKVQNHNEQLQKILEKMEKDSKLTPMDVVANFEKEQEAQSIISYKELVDAVKNRQDDNYEDELESKPLTTVTEFLGQKDEQEPIDFSDFTTVINTIHEKKEEKNFNDRKEERNNISSDDFSKFRNTEVISPIYGRMNQSSKEVDYGKTIDLRDIDLSDDSFLRDKKEETKDDTALSSLEDVYKKMNSGINKPIEKGDTTSLDALARNEEFLQSLKDFRKNL